MNERSFIGVRGRVILTLSILGVVFMAVIMKHEERLILIDSATAFYASCSRSLATQAGSALAHGDRPQLQRQLAMAAEGPGVEYAAVLEPDGTVLASVGGPSPSFDASRFVERIEGSEIRSLDRASFIILHPLGGPPYVDGKVVLAVSSDALATHLRGNGSWRIWSLVFVALLALVVAVWADRHVSWSARQLLEGTRELSRGNLDARVSIRTGDMLEQLGDDFNLMAARIKSAEERLRLANEDLNDKVKELDLLSSGLAHELNNPLAAISAIAEDLVDRIAEGNINAHDVALRLSAVGQDVQRCQRLVSDLLVYSRPVAQGREQTDLSAILEHVVYVARKSRPALQAEVTANVADDLPYVVGSSDLYQQVFINLLTNALDVISQKGIVSIHATRTDDGVRVVVKDDGAGVPVETADRIFEPFFTTKPAGKGTGLGLAIARRIMAGLGGRIHLVNAGAPGATFVVEAKGS